MVRVSTGAESKQDYQSPANFIEAFELRFGPISFDLAASAHNKQHKCYFAAPNSEDGNAIALDSLAQDWVDLSGKRPRSSNLWLNPEFRHIKPWAKKCLESAPYLKNDTNIPFLVPASVGSDWYNNYVFEKPCTHTIFLNGRLCFNGIDLFPKDCMLIMYGPKQDGKIEQWKWERWVKEFVNEKNKRQIENWVVPSVNQA